MALAARATARVQFSHLDTTEAEAELREAVETLRARGNTWAEAITEVSLGRLAWVRGATDDALAHFDRATSVAEARGDLFTTVGRRQPPRAR